VSRYSFNQPYVYIVILNWNNAHDTLACLHSLTELDYPNYAILVIDNGSSDGSAERIRADNSTVEVMELATNIGYAAGNNAGIDVAVERGAEYVLILNNDTFVEPTMLSELVAFMESDPKIGMVGPTMYCADPNDTLFAAGSFINWSKGKTWHRGMFEEVSKYADLNSPESVDFISGCCLLVRRELIEVAGLFDPTYFLNYEDVEWAVRARRFGFDVMYVPQAVMWHKVSSSLGQASPANIYYTTRNALRFFLNNAPTHLRWLAISRIMGRTLRTVAAWTVKSQYQNGSFERRRRANLFALRDFFQGHFGKMGPDVTSVCSPS